MDEYCSWGVYRVIRSLKTHFLMINKFIYLYSCTVNLFDKARRLIIGLDVVADETPSADLLPDKEPEADLGAY